MLNTEFLDYIEGSENPLVMIYRRLEEYVMQDIIRRIATSEGQVVTASAEWQMTRLIALGELPDNILNEIKKALHLSGAEFDELIADAVKVSSRFDESIIAKMGITPPPIEENEMLLRYLAAVKKQTKDLFTNLTASLGFAVKKNGKITYQPLAKFYQETLDLAMTQVKSGAVDYATAIRQASDKMVNSGLRWIDYASGHRDRAEVAVRRAVLTGMYQVSNKVAEIRLDDFDSDLVRVSAHEGARDTGTGPANHKAWQGKVYRWVRPGHPQTSIGDYPDFIAATGYGTGEGLGGWNCSHGIGSFIEGVSEPQYTQEQLDSIDPPPFTYQGKTYSYYEATQLQRSLERSIRAGKTKVLLLQKAIDVSSEEATRAKLKQDYANSSIRLRQQQSAYRSFSKAGGLRQDSNRMRVKI